MRVYKLIKLTKFAFTKIIIPYKKKIDFEAVQKVRICSTIYGLAFDPPLFTLCNIVSILIIASWNKQLIIRFAHHIHILVCFIFFALNKSMINQNISITSITNVIKLNI